ncbi:MAG: right-handed parallel beta-helix repeat-containing protein, partial [bacterium]
MIKYLALLSIALTTLALHSSAATVSVTTPAELTAALAKAVPGTTVQLAPGTYACMLAIPAGVTLRGAGYGKTILDVGAAATGVTLAGDGAAIADLAVTTRGGTAILARGVKGVGLSRILIRGGAAGVSLRDVQGARVENCIVESSFTGLALTDVTGAAIVNNTLTRCDSTGFALSKVSASAVFNNLVVHAGVAVSVSQAGAGLRVDHNLYLALYAGKIDDELARISLGPWRDVSGGLDAQSVCQPVVFRDATNGDYQPVSTLDWNPGIPTTANWGVAKLGEVAAPVWDIAHAKRPAFPGVGAREGKSADVDEDGTFKVKESAGTKSAGVFTRDGTLVRYLFRDLPLPAGKYGFVLPSRSGQGAPIAAGKYELRIVESNLRWDYRMLTGNNGTGTQEGESDKCGVSRAVLGGDNTLITGCGWSEHQENIKARDLVTGQPRWVLPGSTDPLWLCRGSDGLIYVLRKDDLIRLDNQGQLQPWPVGGLKLPMAIPAANGVAELGGNLYVTSSSGEVWRVSVATGKQELAVKAVNPLHLVADHKRGLLWMICGGQGFSNGVVTAFAPDGTIKYIVRSTVGASLAKTAVAEPALAVAGERRPYESTGAGDAGTVGASLAKTA